MPTHARADGFLPFEQEENPWERLERTAREFKPDPVEAWKWMYTRWKGVYSNFRQLEQQSLYGLDEKSKPVKPNEGTLRAHRQCISYLMFSADELGHQLDHTTSGLKEQADKDEAHALKTNLGTMVEALIESLELWHPANKTECPESLKGIFDK